MTNPPPQPTPDASAAQDRPIPPVAVRPAGYAAPARFLQLTHPEDLALLSELAGQLLQDPLAVRRLSDRVVELLHQDLMQQQERNHGYGRRR
ncbi:MAG: hypothetical protein DCF22_09165 [Leptolyngbya sp.]|nr:MAG: hypothetical protein DCF22_09165 [Leptolyngbya sp.]